jgi:hypothetical protein
LPPVRFPARPFHRNKLRQRDQSAALPDNQALQEFCVTEL